MLRLGAIFIVFCMVLIAASSGAVLYLLAGLKAAEAMIVAVAVMTGLATYHAVTSRLRDRSDIGSQIADLSRGTGDLGRQVAELGRRTVALEAQGDRIIDSAAERTRSANEAITGELAEVGNLVKQLAETVALHELKFAGAPNFMTAALKEAAPAAVVESAPAVVEAPAAESNHAAMIETVTEALDAGRVDLYLQPIVTLPQRKVRYYEAFTRLRTANGVVVTPAEFLEAAEAGGLMPRIDKLLLFRAVQVVRRLQLKNREIGLFCNLAAATLNDSETFPEILQFMDANRALAPALILEMRQSTLRASGPMENESLAAMRELGFRFCMDQVTDLRMEPRDLGERGIRYVKISAPFLLGEANSHGSDIHAADMSDLLGRFGISLIAERIEGESQVVDLLEYDVRFGQGFLFSQPRPVRAEALRGAPEESTPESTDMPRKVAAGGSGAAF
ncbi:MAG: EAL domain-containing protein [Alphaproteobacteria bacterium]|nr:EAL domain-containing protein [Alphaproteobacteria bacterium]